MMTSVGYDPYFPSPYKRRVTARGAASGHDVGAPGLGFKPSYCSAGSYASSRRSYPAYSSAELRLDQAAQVGGEFKALRTQEKAELQGLNDRFANFIDRVQKKEERRKKEERKKEERKKEERKKEERKKEERKKEERKKEERKKEERKKEERKKEERKKEERKKEERKKEERKKEERKKEERKKEERKKEERKKEERKKEERKKEE
ncbi:nucleolar protein 58-like, partial [Cynoglossus semilaevis]|uniref:nucleolar protein 58-like n=1 Tax=Cynoglossus semilaevis TaxID=244447 RepID=UPI000D628289